MTTVHDVKSVEQRTADLLQESDGAILWESDASAVHFSFVSESAGAVLGCPAQQWLAERGFLHNHVHLTTGAASSKRCTTPSPTRACTSASIAC